MSDWADEKAKELWAENKWTVSVNPKDLLEDIAQALRDAFQKGAGQRKESE